MLSNHRTGSYDLEYFRMENMNGWASVEQENKEIGFKLTKQHMNELKRAFDYFDKGDGKIPNRKLGEVLRALGQNPTDVEIQELINEYDYNSNGSIEFDELVDVMKLKFRESDSESELQHAFRVFDSEERGWVKTSDLRCVMTYLEDKLTEAEMDAMISETVGNSNKETLEYEHFVDLMDLKEKKKKKKKKKSGGMKKYEVEEAEPRVWFADV